jgi:hypothetical protein
MRINRFLTLMFSLFALFTIGASAATYTVTKVADTNDGTCDADCSLREAVTAANASADNDTIVFATLFNTVQTIVLSLNEIVIGANGSLTITGPGAGLLTLDGNLATRIISTSANVNAEINGIKFTRGNGVGAVNTGRGGAIYNVGGTLVLRNVIVDGNSAPNGGGLNNAGSASPAIPAILTIENSIVSNNTATGSGGGMQNFSTSTVTITNSLFIGNVSNGTTGGGGGQFNGGVRITNSTFSGNSAPAGGGGGMQSNGTLGTILTNVTISGNSAGNNGGGIHRGTTNANFFIRNSIVAGNTGPVASPDFTNSAAGNQSQGNNIIGNTGTSTGWIASDLLNTNPLLGPLANNGGATQTFLPQAGSPAIDGGQNCVINSSCTANNAPFDVTTDQRGVARPQGANVDIGSVEVAGAVSNVTVIGRVLTSTGNPVRGSIVTMVEATPTSSGIPTLARVAYTPNLGYFIFEGVQGGRTYQFSATAKGYTFTPQTIAVNGDITNLVITAQPNVNLGEQK